MLVGRSNVKYCTINVTIWDSLVWQLCMLIVLLLSSLFHWRSLRMFLNMRRHKLYFEWISTTAVYPILKRIIFIVARWPSRRKGEEIVTTKSYQRIASRSSACILFWPHNIYIYTFRYHAFVFFNPPCPRNEILQVEHWKWKSGFESIIANRRFQCQIQICCNLWPVTIVDILEY